MQMYPIHMLEPQIGGGLGFICSYLLCVNLVLDLYTTEIERQNATECDLT